MKFHFLFIIGLLATITVYSQKQFEGMIVYKMHSSQEQHDAQLVILFGKEAVKIKMIETDHPGREELLIQLNSGEMFTLNTEDKTYSAKRLSENKMIDTVFSAKRIAGFTATPVTIPDNPIRTITALFAGRSIPVVYIADSLFFAIPGKYSSNPELIFSRDGKIILGLETRGNSFLPGEDKDDLRIPDISIEAVSVKWETFDAYEFSVPADFIKYSDQMVMIDSVRRQDSAWLADSVAKAAMDSTLVPKTKAVKKSPVNNKQPAKPKAKTNNTKTGDIRKPE